MPKTKIISRNVVIGALYDADLDEKALREDYSEHGMYSDKCFGIVFDEIDQILRWAAFMAANGGASLNFLSSACSDSWGFMTIVYFPGYTLGDE